MPCRVLNPAGEGRRKRKLFAGVLPKPRIPIPTRKALPSPLPHSALWKPATDIPLRSPTLRVAARARDGNLPAVEDFLVILNPAARSEKAAALARDVRRTCAGAELRYTTAPGEARQIAAHARSAGYRAIVAAGGDGTINEVVNGLEGSGIPLGVLPLGTMNVFAIEMGLPAGDWRKCWDIIRAGRTRHIDLPSANGHRFVQLAGVGFDAQIVEQTSGEFKRNWGPLSYVINAAHIAGRHPPRLVAEADGTVHEGSFVMIGNGRFYGGPFRLFNDAAPDDGKLDMLLFQNLGYLDIVRYLQAILFGLHPKLPDVVYAQAHTITVTSSEPVPVETDGDVIGRVPVTFTLAPRGLPVIVPEGE